MDFISLIEEALLEEGYFHVPLSVYKDVMDYYLEMYEKFKTNLGKKVMGKNTYPSKTFDLKLDGTQWDYLKNYHPKITIQFTANNKNQHISADSALHGVMKLSFDDFDRVTTEIMEHEVAHQIQDLIKLEKKKKNKLPNVAKQGLGGLPPKRFIDQRYDAAGNLKSNVFGRRTVHTLRPVEYYTDLLSVLRHLQHGYWEKIKDMPNYKELLKSEKAKKDYFMDYYNRVKDTKKAGGAWIVGRFKSLPNNFFNYAFKILYDAFVNKDTNVDWDYIRSRKEEIEKKVAEKEAVTPFSFEFEKGKPIFNSSNDQFELGPLDEHIEDGRSDFENELLGELGLRETEDRWGDYIYRLPKNEGGVRRLFQKLRKLKESGDILSNFVYDTEDFEPSKEEIKQMYDAIFIDLRLKYVDALSWSNKGTDKGATKLVEFINSVYGWEGKEKQTKTEII